MDAATLYTVIGRCLRAQAHDHREISDHGDLQAGGGQTAEEDAL